MTEPAERDRQGAAPKQPEPRKENIFLNLGLNIIIPTVILVKFSGEQHLGPQWGIIVALAFPVLYGVMDFFAARKINFFSVLGVISIILTGGISLLRLDPQYIAIKEAAIPGLFGIATLVSLKTRWPLVRTLLYNHKIMQVDRVAAALEEKNNERQFDRTLTRASYLIAASFFLSSFLNYVLAKVILTSPPGTEAYNAELGKMTALSLPVIVIPAMLVLFGALYYLFRSITRLTQLSLEEIFVDQNAAKGS
jgi:hypothetical protein